MAQGLTPLHSLRADVFDVQGRHLHIQLINEAILHRSAPGGEDENAALHAYCQLVAEHLTWLCDHGAAACGKADRLALADYYERRGMHP